MDDWIFLDWSTIEYIWRADGGPGAQAALVEVQGAEGQLWAGTVLTFTGCIPSKAAAAAAS